MIDWIFTSDRLPPDDSYRGCKEYFIHFGNRYWSRAFYYSKRWTEDPDSFGQEFRGVVAWAEIPEELIAAHIQPLPRKESEPMSEEMAQMLRELSDSLINTQNEVIKNMVGE